MECVFWKKKREIHQLILKILIAYDLVTAHMHVHFTTGTATFCRWKSQQHKLPELKFLVQSALLWWFWGLPAAKALHDMALYRQDVNLNACLID